MVISAIATSLRDSDDGSTTVKAYSVLDLHLGGGVFFVSVASAGRLFNLTYLLTLGECDRLLQV